MITKGNKKKKKNIDRISKQYCRRRDKKNQYLYVVQHSLINDRHK